MGTELPTGLYVHIPFCVAKCPYCGFYSVAVGSCDTDRFLAALVKEMDRYDGLDSIQTIYVGGGSPSCLGRDQLEWLVKQLNQRFTSFRSPGAQSSDSRLPDYLEFTLEVNPAQIDGPRLEGLRRLGVNRISVGAQSFNQAELDFLGRPYSPNDVAALVKSARSVGFDNINLDLIFASPNSTEKSWRNSLDQALALEPQHISAYSLSIEKNTPFAGRLKKGEFSLVDEQIDRAMYDSAVKFLGRVGLEQYEISNFAQLGFACRHNLTYWNNQPWIGIGPAAASYFNHSRTQNLADVDAYIAAIEADQSPVAQRHNCDKQSVACETAVLMLRLVRGIDLAQFNRQTGYEALELFAEPIERYNNLGLLKIDEKSIALTDQARPIADSILCDFASL